MWNKTFAVILTIGFIGASGSIACADEKDEADLGKVAAQLPKATVTLQQGLTVSEAQGQPISGKFEVDEGHFQLSTYTAKGGKFQENLVNHTTGVLAKSEPITGGEDLAEAKSQAEAIAKAKKPLKWAVDEAEKASAGFRAVSVTSRLSKGHAVAVVTLLKGTQSKSLTEPLE